MTGKTGDATTNAIAWADYKRRRNWFFGAWLGGFLIVAILMIVISSLRLGEIPMYLVAIAWAIAFVLAAVRLQLFLCPRCRCQFFRYSLYYNPFARRCVHCGLQKWAEPGQPR